MSALLRPLGDEIATVYGAYKTKKEVKKIAKGDKLDILCSDGLNYHVEVKEVGSVGRLHFRHWSVKYDYIGSFDELYLAQQGTFSDGISAQNTYPTLVKRDSVGEKPKSSSTIKNQTNPADSRPQNFPSGTRYPEDFLSKPRYAASHSRKRAIEDVVDNRSTRARSGNNSKIVEDENVIKDVSGGSDMKTNDDDTNLLIDNILENVTPTRKNHTLRSSTEKKKGVETEIIETSEGKGIKEGQKKVSVNHRLLSESDKGKDASISASQSTLRMDNKSEIDSLTPESTGTGTRTGTGSGTKTGTGTKTATGTESRTGAEEKSNLSPAVTVTTPKSITNKKHIVNSKTSASPTSISINNNSIALKIESLSSSDSTPLVSTVISTAVTDASSSSSTSSSTSGSSSGISSSSNSCSVSENNCNTSAEIISNSSSTVLNNGISLVSYASSNILSSSTSSSTSSSIPPSTPSSSARIIPSYQVQVQRIAQLKYLREILNIEKSIYDTTRAIDIVTNHPMVFQKENKDNSFQTVNLNPIYTAKQLLDLLHARKKIDEVIQQILPTL